MSADNALVVLSTPVGADGESFHWRQYRIGEVQAPENLVSQEIEPARLKALLLDFFGASQVFEREELAWRAVLARADEIRQSGNILEYGVFSIRLEQPYPSC